MDLDGDGQISRHELKSLIKNFGGEVSKEKIEHFIKQVILSIPYIGLEILSGWFGWKWKNRFFWVLGALVKYQGQHWGKIHGLCFLKILFVIFQDDLEIRAEFLRYDLDNSGYITKGWYRIYVVHHILSLISKLVVSNKYRVTCL